MFSNDKSYRPTKSVEVVLTLFDKEPFVGVIFVGLGKRVSDLLNDDRSFLPVQQADDSIIMVSKGQIKSIVETGVESMSQREAPTYNNENTDRESPDQEDETEAQETTKSHTDDIAKNKNSTQRKEPTPEKPAQKAAPEEKSARENAEEEINAAREEPHSEYDQTKKKQFDPYKVLRVGPDSSIDEIRRAYKKRMKAVHPDSVASLDLDEDLEKAAVLATQKVNYAYKKILKDRSAMAEEKEAS